MTFKQIQPAATIKIIFAFILSLAAIYLFLEGTMLGVVLLGAALKLALREGVEVDLKNKRYRKLYSFFGLGFGRWTNLPSIEYISVFKTTKNVRSRVITAEANMGFVVYKLNLFHNTNKHIEAYITDDKEDAFNVAKSMSTVLDVEIFDATNN